MTSVPNENSPLLGNWKSKEEEVLEEKEEAEVVEESTSPPTSYWGKLNYFISNITVEPLLFLHSMSYSVASVFYTNMMIDKTCSIQLNYSKEICDHLDSGDYKAEQDEVQRITTKYSLYCSWIEYGLAILVMVLLSTWSDIHGRKIGLLLPMIGDTLKSLGLLANAYFWSWPPFFIILSYIPYGLGGSSMAIYIAAFAYVSDNSSNRSRTTRISLTGLLSYAAYPMGHFVGMKLYIYDGYVGVFSTQFIISVLATLYVLLRFRSGPPQRQSNGTTDEKGPQRQKKMSLVAIKESLTVVIKPREGKQRAHLIFHILIIWITVASYGASAFTFLYTRKKFRWDYYSYTIFSIVNTPVSLIASCVILPLLSYRFQLEDSMLGFIGSCSHLFYGVITGTAPFSWLLYIALVISSLSGMVTTSSRGAMSKLVKTDELGGVFCTVALGEAILPLILDPIYTLIYNSTLEIFPGTVYLVGSFYAVVVCFMYTWILTNEDTRHSASPVV